MEPKTLLDTVLFMMPSLLLITGWTALHRYVPSRRLCFAFWLILMGGLSVAGAVEWDATQECSQLASAAMASSTLWFSGPALVWTVLKPWKAVWSWLAAVILPFVSFITCVFVLLGTGQIWGM